MSTTVLDRSAQAGVDLAVAGPALVELALECHLVDEFANDVIGHRRAHRRLPPEKRNGRRGGNRKQKRGVMRVCDKEG